MTNSSLQRWAPAAAALAASGVLLGGLSAFGIWDPWEIEVSELARGRGLVGGLDPQAGARLVGLGFRLFGVQEWSGRLPIAICGLLFLGLLYRWVASEVDRTTAAYAALIAGTSPLFLFNAVTMMGEAPWILLQTLVACCALGALHASRPGVRGAWCFGLLASSGVAIAARGALVCALPPLCAAALCAGFAGRLRGAEGRRADPIAWGLVVATAVIAFLVARDIVADRAAYSVFLGGAPVGGQPPSFDAAIERAFHAFAPWSALLPLGLTVLAARESDAIEGAPRHHRLALFCLLWIAFGYAAQTLFWSRYGQRSALWPLGAMAIVVALLLRELPRGRGGQWPAAIAVLLLCLLLLRDYVLYPASPMYGLPVAEIKLPDGFNPKRAWAAVLLPFSLVATLCFGQDADARPALDLRAPYRFVGVQWRRGLAFRLWIAAGAAVLLGLFVFGLVSLIPSVSRRLTTLAAKFAVRAMWTPFALAFAVAGLQLLLAGVGRLRAWRFVPMFLTAGAIALYALFGFVPALSQQLSPRDVYDSYNRLAKAGEPLAEYGVKSRAAAYYAKGKPLEIDTVAALVDHLSADERRWAVFPADELNEIDRAFRQRHRRHLFIADERSARAFLASNHTLPGVPDKNPLTQAVLFEAPAVETPLLVDFDDKVQLLGYALKLPHGDRVGQGEQFDITWYFKVLRSVPGNYRVFVHVDGEGARIGGDHDPVEGRYPIRLWSPGDVIVDRQTIAVPASSARGTYTIYMGLYSGDTRLPIKQGPHDVVDRAITGVLRIR